MKTLLQKHMETVIKSKSYPKQKKSIKLPVQINMQDFAKKLLFSLSISIFLSSCCISQIQTQYVFLDDSCNYYLPDYTQAITVRDNCQVTSFFQVPTSGTLIESGNDIQVTITAIDWIGNEKTMSFDVVAIDTIPPSFHYDSVLFIPSGMFQNETRTYHFYSLIISDSSFNLYYK